MGGAERVGAEEMVMEDFLGREEEEEEEEGVAEAVMKIRRNQ